MFIFQIYKRCLRIYSRRRFAMGYYRSNLKFLNRWIWLDTEGSNFYYKLKPLNQIHLAHAISAATGEDFLKIQNYFNELEGDEKLREHIKSSVLKAGYGSDIEVNFGRRLGWYAIVRSTKPKVVIETGVDHGVGSCVLVSALIRNALEGAPGNYYGTDINPEAGKLLCGEYSHYGEILYGDSITSLRKFKGDIDLFINDSDHSSSYELLEYQTISNKLTPNGIILGDNSHGTDSLSTFSEQTGRNFIFWAENPLNHWYPGAGIGISWSKH